MEKETKRLGRGQMLLSILVMQGAIIALALLFRPWTGVDALGSFALTPMAVIAGVAGAFFLFAAMLGARHLFPDIIKPLEKQVVDIFREGGIVFTWPIILATGLAAGIGEELFFRGALQVWMTEQWGLLAALVGSNLFFAVLHPHSRAYMVLVFLIGLYLAALFLWSGNILVPIIAHALYDILALKRIAVMMDEAERSGEVEADR